MAAIECLGTSGRRSRVSAGTSPAKAKDVRAAALRALAIAGISQADSHRHLEESDRRRRSRACSSPV